MSILRIALALTIATGLTSAVAAQTPTAPESGAPPTVSAPVDQSAPPPATPMTATPDAGPAAGANSSVTVGADGVRTLHIASSPVPDTLANRAKYGPPMSNGGRKTRPIGN
jgi:hypothetical protein